MTYIFENVGIPYDLHIIMDNFIDYHRYVIVKHVDNRFAYIFTAFNFGL